jgi:hypothetical protein
VEVLRAVCNHTVDHRGLNQLIELTQSFAYTYLKHRYSSFSHIPLAEDYTINEMAIDAIAFLFERDDSGTLIRIKQAFEQWTPEIKSEEQALFFINRLAAKSSEKYISELLKASDPVFSKIHRSVNYLIQTRGYKKKQIFGTTYIITDEEINIGKLPDPQFIYDLPVNLFDSMQVIPGSIFDYIKNNSDRTPAIPLNAMVIKIQRSGAGEYIRNESIQPDNIFEIEIIADRAAESAIEKLEISYLGKHKISKEESEAIKKALRQAAMDMQDGGINTGLHKYLMQEMPSLSFEDYKEKYQNIFEYLFKILKREFIHHLEE